MNENCARSCTACEKSKQRKTKEYPATTELGVGTDVILEESASFGEKQVADGGEREQTIERVKATIDYMGSEKVTTLSPAIKESCINRHELCAFWAILGKSRRQNRIIGTNQCFHMLRCNHFIQYLQVNAKTMKHT